MCNEIDLLQRDFESAFQDLIHFRKNIIRIVKKHSILTTDLINTMVDTFALINSLHSSIINYEAVIKNRGQNTYVQKKNEFEDYDDAAEIYFTDRQYRDRPRDRLYRKFDAAASFRSHRHPFQRSVKKCFVCEKKNVDSRIIVRQTAI